MFTYICTSIIEMTYQAPDTPSLGPLDCDASVLMSSSSELSDVMSSVLSSSCNWTRRGVIVRVREFNAVSSSRMFGNNQ